MERILEPEIMDDIEQVEAYVSADFADSNKRYLQFLKEHCTENVRSILDLGCGPADIDVLIAKTFIESAITAVDGSESMIVAAKQAIADAGVADRIELVCGYIPGLELEEKSFDAVLSKDMLHHLPDPTVLWQEALRLGRSGATLCVVDLIRPNSVDHAKTMVEERTANEAEILKIDYFNSLLAAFTIDEVIEQTKSMGINASVIESASSPHMLIHALLP